MSSELERESVRESNNLCNSNDHVLRLRRDKSIGQLEKARKGGFNIVALDLGLDLSTQMGELAANVLAEVAQWRTHDSGAYRRRL